MSRKQKNASDDRQIIFFDGVCNLCNGFVDFLVRHDHQNKFQFAPLQGETAAARLPPEKIRALHSVVLLSEGRLYEKSDAVVKILGELGGIWGVFGLTGVLPRFLRDRVYDLVAAQRYLLFGRRETCRLPSPAERARFLD